MTCSPVRLPPILRRSGPAGWVYRVSAGWRCGWSAPVSVPILPVGAWRRSGGRLIRLITLMAVSAPAHYYQDCHDPDCMMFGCRAYKTGWRDGYDEGYEEGYAAGYAAGYSAGFAAGMAAAGNGGS